MHHNAPPLGPPPPPPHIGTFPCITHALALIPFPFPVFQPSMSIIETSVYLPVCLFCFVVTTLPLLLYFNNLRPSAYSGLSILYLLSLIVIAQTNQRVGVATLPQDSYNTVSGSVGRNDARVIINVKGPIHSRLNCAV